jgi:hypothetical protein
MVVSRTAQAGYAAAVEERLAAATEQGVPFVVIEGFQLLGGAGSGVAIPPLDGLIAIEVADSVAWERRKARALSMAHLPPGAVCA